MSQIADVTIEVSDQAIDWLVEHLKGRPISIENQWLFRSVTGVLEQGALRLSSATRAHFNGRVQIEGALRQGLAFRVQSHIETTLRVRIDHRGVRFAVDALRLEDLRASSPTVRWVARMLTQVARMTSIEVLRSFPLVAPLRELFSDQTTGQTIVRHLVPAGAGRDPPADAAANPGGPGTLLLRFGLERPSTAIAPLSPAGSLRRWLLK